MKVHLDVTLEVRNDPAYGIVVSVRHPDKIEYRTVTGDSLVPECYKDRFVSSVTCNFKEVDADEKARLLGFVVRVIVW